jgi:hypothetical protein
MFQKVFTVRGKWFGRHSVCFLPQSEHLFSGQDGTYQRLLPREVFGTGHVVGIRTKSSWCRSGGQGQNSCAGLN